MCFQPRQGRSQMIKELRGEKMVQRNPEKVKTSLFNPAMCSQADGLLRLYLENKRPVSNYLVNVISGHMGLFRTNSGELPINQLLPNNLFSWCFIETFYLFR